MSKKNIWLCLVIVIAAIVMIASRIAYSNTISEKQAEQMRAPTRPFPMNDPKPGSDTENLKIPSVNDAVTFILSADNNIYYYKGSFAGNLKKTDFNSVGEIIKKTITETKLKNVFFIIKSDEKASFKTVLTFWDDMTTENVPAGHYAEAEITVKENEAIKKYKEQ